MVFCDSEYLEILYRKFSFLQVSSHIPCCFKFLATLSKNWFIKLLNKDLRVLSYVDPQVFKWLKGIMHLSLLRFVLGWFFWLLFLLAWTKLDLPNNAGLFKNLIRILTKTNFYVCNCVYIGMVVARIIFHRQDFSEAY